MAEVQRMNVDQVPLPFVNDMDSTYSERGGKIRVTVNQLGPSLSKRQATGQLCFRPVVPPASYCTNSDAERLHKKYLQEQPAPCIIFPIVVKSDFNLKSALPKSIKI